MDMLFWPCCRLDVNALPASAMSSVQGEGAVKVPVSPEVLRTLFRLMQQAYAAGAIPNELLAELQRVQQQCAKVLPTALSAQVRP